MTAARLRRPVGQALAAIALLAPWLVAMVALTGPLSPRGRPTGFATLSPGLTMLDAATGLALLGAGTLGWSTGRRLVGGLLLATSSCWFGADLAAWAEAPAALVALGRVMAPLGLVGIAGATLVLARPPAGRAARAALVLAGLATVGLTLTWVATYAPAGDPHCWGACAGGPVLVDAPVVSRRLEAALALLMIATGSGLALGAALRLARATRAQRRRTWPVLLPAAAAGSAWVATGLVLLGARPPYQVTAPEVGLFVARSVAAATFAAGVAWTLLLERRTQEAVRRLTDLLTPLPGDGTLKGALAAMLHDPGASLAFAVDGSGWVDEHGVPVAPPPRETIRLSAADRPAVVLIPSQPVPLDSAAVATAAGDAVRLAAENERLLAAIRHELRELQASRERIVAAADDERRRLERDLHDGAQQRVLSVLSWLGTAELAAAASGRPDAAIVAVTAEMGRCADALRRIAHGIHPTELMAGGLAAALERLADDAPLPVELELDPGAPPPGPAGAVAGWRLADAAIDAAARADATGAQIGLAGDPDGGLVLRLAIEGPERRPDLDLEPLEDRVAVAGGRLRVGDGGPAIWTVEAWLPAG